MQNLNRQIQFNAIIEGLNDILILMEDNYRIFYSARA